MLVDDNCPEDRFSEAASFRMHHATNLREKLRDSGWVEVTCVMAGDGSTKLGKYIREYLLSDQVSVKDLVLFPERYALYDHDNLCCRPMYFYRYVASCRTPEIASTIQELNAMHAIVDDISTGMCR